MVAKAIGVVAQATILVHPCGNGTFINLFFQDCLSILNLIESKVPINPSYEEK